MDGRALVELLEPQVAARNPVVISDVDAGHAGVGNREYTEGEEDEILDRLRDLGYLN